MFLFLSSFKTIPAHTLILDLPSELALLKFDLSANWPAGAPIKLMINRMTLTQLTTAADTTSILTSKRCRQQLRNEHFKLNSSSISFKVLLVVSLAILAIENSGCNATSTPSLFKTSIIDDPTLADPALIAKSAYGQIGHLCRRMSSFKELAQMQELIDNLKLYLGENSDGINGSQSNMSIDWLAHPGSALSSLVGKAPAEKCLEQAQAILDLEPILQSRESVCSKAHLDLLEQYHNKWSLLDRRLVTGRFLTLYGNQVSFLCKSSLLHTLTMAEEKLSIGQSDFEKAMPWLKRKSCSSSSVADDLVSDVLMNDNDDNDEHLNQYCLAQQALTNVHNINELAAVINSNDQLQSSSLIGDQKVSIPSAANPLQDSTIGAAAAAQVVEPETGKDEVFLVVPDSLRPILNRMLGACSRLQPVYQNTVLPIVRLLKLGYDPEFRNFEKICRESEQVRRWFSATLVCNSLLSSHVENKDELRIKKEEVQQLPKNGRQESFVVVQEEKKEANEETHDAFKGNISKQEENNLMELIRVPIDNELWMHKYRQTSSLDRVRSKFYNLILKAFHVEDVADHIIMRRRVRDYSHLTFKIILMTLTVVVLGKTI